MQKIDVSGKVAKFIKFGLVGFVAVAAMLGWGMFKFYNHSETIKIENAKTAGTMVAQRVLTNGKIKEIIFSDGDEVKAGEVIAKIEVSVTEEEISQLENTVALAKKNFEELKLGQVVKVAVKKPKLITRKNSATLESLAERANRMNELFEMGAVSAVQRDAARAAYEKARAAGVPSSGDAEFDIEYVEQLMPTPPEVLAGAEKAVKQAELSLNVAKQEAQQTEVTSPINGTIFYNVSGDEEINAGDVVARIGDSRELWVEAEVSQGIFDKIPIGKLANFKINGEKLFGTVTEKIAPEPTEEKSDKPQDEKFVLKISLPTDSDVEIKPNETVSVEINLN